MSTTLRSEMKPIIHQGHFELESPKKRARQALLWPLVNSEIEDMKKNCPTYLTFRKRQPSEPTIKHPVPEELWNKLVADFFLIVWTLLFIGCRL